MGQSRAITYLIAWIIALLTIGGVVQDAPAQETPPKDAQGYINPEARRLAAEAAAEEKGRAAEAKTTRCQISRRNEPNSRRRRTARRRGETSRH
jgi:hypothetical protein